jgi:hypothetical protein
MGNLSSHAVKIIVIRVSIKKREVKAQELRKVLLEDVRVGPVSAAPPGFLAAKKSLTAAFPTPSPPPPIPRHPLDPAFTFQMVEQRRAGFSAQMKPPLAPVQAGAAGLPARMRA